MDSPPRSPVIGSAVQRPPAAASGPSARSSVGQKIRARARHPMVRDGCQDPGRAGRSPAGLPWGGLRSPGRQREAALYPARTRDCGNRHDHELGTSPPGHTPMWGPGDQDRRVRAWEPRRRSGPRQRLLAAACSLRAHARGARVEEAWPPDTAVACAPAGWPGRLRCASAEGDRVVAEPAGLGERSWAVADRTGKHPTANAVDALAFAVQPPVLGARSPRSNPTRRRRSVLKRDMSVRSRNACSAGCGAPRRRSVRAEQSSDMR